MKIGVIIPVKKFSDRKNRLSSVLTLDEKKELLANLAEVQEKYENLLADIEEDGETSK